MAKLITLNQSSIINTTEEVRKEIIINSDMIQIIEDTEFNVGKNITRIKFYNKEEMIVVETKEEVKLLVNT